MKKIKILWVSNVPPLSLNESGNSSSGGWLQGSLSTIRANESFEFILSFPITDKAIAEQGVVDGIPYFGFYVAGYPKYSQLRTAHYKMLQKKIKRIIETVQPDLLHIFGSEFPHSQIAVECFNRPNASIIHIQGLVSRCAEHATLGIPFWARNLIVPSSLFNGTPGGQARAWKRAGRSEQKAIRGVKNVVGRTEWDEACSMQINPSVRYFHHGETLRQVFYSPTSQWKLEQCDQHTIYFSQGFDQIKGIHTIIPVLPELIKRFPNTHLYVGGPSPINQNLLKRRSYGFYIASLIRKYRLGNHITFLGPQNASQVVENLKRAHVFLSASLIENSPNAVGEALLMGVPTVSSDVGGVKDFIEHGKSGFIYPVDEPYMIPYYVGKIFDTPEIAEIISNEGRVSASRAYDAERNGLNLANIYLTLSKPMKLTERN